MGVAHRQEIWLATCMYYWLILSLPRKSAVRVTDRPDMTIAVYPERKTTQQQHHISSKWNLSLVFCLNNLNEQFVSVVAL